MILLQSQKTKTTPPLPNPNKKTKTKYQSKYQNINFQTTPNNHHYAPLPTHDYTSLYPSDSNKKAKSDKQRGVSCIYWTW